MSRVEDYLHSVDGKAHQSAVTIITALELDLAEAREDARNWKAEAEDNLYGWKISKTEIEAMRPVVAAATSFVSDPYPQSRLQFLEVTKNYLKRKQP